MNNRGILVTKLHPNEISLTLFKIYVAKTLKENKQNVEAWV